MSRLAERLLWFLAAASFSGFALSAAESWLYQSYYSRELAQLQTAPPRLHPDGATPAAAAPETKAAAEGQPMGRLEIPSIHISSVFLEGVDTRTLRRGVGHVPGTGLPGGTGNVTLSAHRDTFFRRLRDIRTHDLIFLTTPGRRYQYIVESMKVINPDEAIVLRSIGRPTLTLTTCYPFYYIGSAPKRFVVHASLVTVTDAPGAFSAEMARPDE